MGKLGKLQAAEPPLKVELSVESPVKTKKKAARTAQGGEGYERKAKGELFLLAVTNMVGEDTFYEAASARDTRFRELIGQVVNKDPDWIARFIPFLRNTMNMRTAAVVMAAEYALATRGRAGGTYQVRTVVDSALQRADEPGEFIAYWISRTNRRTIPSGVGRGVGDAIARLYNERSALRYDGTNQPWRMGDAIELAHPKPSALWQGALYQYLLDRRHHPSEIRADLELLPIISNNIKLWAMDQEERETTMALATPDTFNAAGMSWETLQSWLGRKPDKQFWEKIAPSMGYMALLRNLRNFEEAKIGKSTVKAICERLSDKDQVAKSRQFPMRFLSAYKAVNNMQWSLALQDALDYSLENVPELKGRTLIAVDMSGSMFAALSAKSELTRAEAAAVFGAALALRAEDPTLIIYGGTGWYDLGVAHTQKIAVPKGGSILPLVTAMIRDMGGTATASALKKHYDSHDRVILLTDEQSMGTPAGMVIPKDTWLHTFNVAGYKVAGSQSGAGKRSAFGGLTDAGFRLIPLLEQGLDQNWPF